MAGIVRVEESLRVKIGEAKNLPGDISRETICKVAFDQEPIFTTATVPKSQNPFFGEEFHCDIPRKFRFLSFYVCEKSNKQDKVVGKVSLKKEELNKYHGRDHWFPLRQVDADSEVQGKVHIEIRFDEQIGHHGSPNCTKHRMGVRLLEANDLTVINGACNPYGAVVLSRDRGKPKLKEEIKKTNVKKKTISPSFDELFIFEVEKKGQNHDRNSNPSDITNIELSVSLWHDDSRVSREMFGNMLRGVFLGEVRIPLKDLDITKPHRAWYFLQPRGANRNSDTTQGSLRVKITYNSDHVFTSRYYDEIKNLLLKSPTVKPITSSAVYLLGDIVDIKEHAAQPLVRVFHEHGQIVQLIGALADWEISKTTDPNTIFRGNTLASKCVDELMKFVGLHYLQDTLKKIIDQIFAEHKSCEIVPSRLKEGESLSANTERLEGYVQKIFEAIVYSGLNCPIVMCEVFYALKEAALRHFPDNKEVRYHVVSGFVFLRFFAPAILGPKLFQLRTDMPDPVTNRTLTLISKTIQSLGNIVSSKSHAYDFKEEYMIPIFRKFTDPQHMQAIKTFLDIISSLTRMHPASIEAPIVLKEGFLTKRAQGRRKLGLKNFKKRYFCLTNHHLTYAKAKGSPLLCTIPIQDILAVEDLQEQTFTRKYMFQVVQPQRALYIQANNCVEEKEWKHILNKVCNMNRNRLKTYHPAAYLKGHWLCCKVQDAFAPGCAPVSGGLPADIKMDLDIDREMERIHSLFFNNMDKLEKTQDACGAQEVYMANDGEDQQLDSAIEDTKSCFQMVSDILECVIRLEQEHKNYLRQMEKEAVLGSQEFPYGDEAYFAGIQTRM